MFRLGIGFACFATSAFGLQPLGAAAADDPEIARGGISRHNGRLQRLPHTGIFFWKTGQLTLSRRVGCRLRNPRRGCFRRSQHHAPQGDRHRQLDQGADRDCHSDRAAPRRPHAGADHAVARICATHKRRRRCNCSIPSKPEAGKPSGAGPVQARGKGIDLYVQDLAAGPNCGSSPKIAVAPGSEVFNRPCRWLGLSLCVCHPAGCFSRHS